MKALADILASLAVASIGYGLFLIYPPSAFIGVGVLVLTGAILVGARS